MLARGGFRIQFSTTEHFVGSDGNGSSDPGFQEVLHEFDGLICCNNGTRCADGKLDVLSGA